MKKLIGDDKIFALAGSSIFNYSSASYVNSQGVSDVGGQPIQGTAYNQYPNLYSIYGGFGFPRDGKQVGYNGQIVSGSADYRWFKEHLGVTTAAVVFFNVAQSEQFAAPVTKIGNDVIFHKTAYGHDFQGLTTSQVNGILALIGNRLKQAKPATARE